MDENINVGGMAQEGAPNGAEQTSADITSKMGIKEAAPEEPQGDALSALLQEPDPKQATTTPKPAEDKEPGWYAKRFARDSAKLIAQINAQWEQKLAPLYEAFDAREAEALVKSGEVKTIERAREYLALKRGNASSFGAAGKTPPVQNTPPQGNPQQSSPPPESTDAEIRVRAEILMEQAGRIRANGGPDVLAAYRTNPDIAQKINNREWDFHDVAAYMQNRRVPPSPMRATNGGEVGTLSIKDLSEAQFEKLQNDIRDGRKFDIRR